ncbi:MAG: DUF362 domain-containing protein [Candidatus Bathyarchaeota archaeon]|nr:MAG: DUF362 domain-containing protein [Candidatus Bathyarchaeota archaeon]
MATLSLARIEDYSNIKPTIERIFNLAKYQLNLKIRRVAVKPNLCYYWEWSTGETTNPQLVSELIDFLRERLSRNLEISIIESDASAMKCKYAFKFLGYERLAKEKKVNLVNLTDDQSEYVKVKVNNQSYSLSVPTTIRKADLFINLPKIKYMPQVIMSCALKNIFGCNPRPNKFKYHGYLAETIVALNKVMKPDFCIVDGIIVLGQSTKRLGLLMASTDPVAIDAAAAKILGLNASKIQYIRLAEKEGLGSTKYETAGDHIDYFVQRFPRRSAINKLTSVANVGLSTLRRITRNV